MVESDDELVRRVRRGEREAFSQLVQRYEKPALAVAYAILRCRHDAGDAVQDAFVTAYVQIHRLWSARKFGAWFFRIVRREALVRLRRNAAHSARLVAVAVELHGRVAGESETADEVAELIARLPEQECVVVTLRHLKELPVGEIARITRRPVGTVTKQLSRAYARMRPWVEEGR